MSKFTTEDEIETYNLELRCRSGIAPYLKRYSNG